VVATYVARAYGVHSGMPMQHAFRKCPDAVFLPNDHPAYDAASAGVMEVMRSFGHPVGGGIGMRHTSAPGATTLKSSPAPFVQPCMITPP
jgi:hypothetical protein